MTGGGFRPLPAGRGDQWHVVCSRAAGGRVETMELTDKITEVLSPHLGAMTADSVARHLCAKHQVGTGPLDPGKVSALQDTIRRGLVAFVGAEKAEDLAARCFEGVLGSS
jgi:hypothetical protein